ncbi:MAG: phosphoribosylformylglycinamidine synthase I [Candidatus Gracilibacteria bacterium]|nr:phosphoribosylformylglycinamidine synthase I [Candidatus Gracilibacteria bacterium]
MTPKALIITGYGINCEEETAKVFEIEGAKAEIIHINDLIENPKKIEEFQIMAFPGGFSYGDDTGSGNAMANKIKNNLNEEFLNFARQDKLIIGICNGFQMLANLGIVPALNDNYGKRTVALMHNSQARYECGWVHLKRTSDKCIWTRGIEIIHLPIAHGEGNFYTDEETLNQIKSGDQIAWKYVKEDGSPANNEFPFNPNGAIEDIAGICDPSGRILGMMPHPERFNCFVNEDGWTLEKEKLIREGNQLPKEGKGLKLFKNAVEYFTK